MGSRAVVLLCRNENVSTSRFGAVKPSLGVVYTRTGRQFFTDGELEQEFLSPVQQAADRAGLWDELATDWMCLDCELMPWSAKAQELLRDQYAPVGNSAVQALQAQQDVLRRAAQRIEGLDELATRAGERLRSVERYVREYRQYCWTVNSLADLKLAPFHLLASEGAVHTDKPHTWHMELLSKLCAADAEVLLATPYRLVELQNEQSCAEAMPENLERLRSRNVGAKRSLASREFALGVESLERFVRREQLRLTHECVFGVLALESEPIDPR